MDCPHDAYFVIGQSSGWSRDPTLIQASGSPSKKNATGEPQSLRFSHAQEFLRWFDGETRSGPGGWEARALLGLCDRYYLLTEIIGRADMRWHGNPGEAVPAGNVWL